MGYNYVKALFNKSNKEKSYSFDKDIEFIEIVKKDNTLFLRNFKHICSPEGNGRPSTYIRDVLYPLYEENAVHFMNDNPSLHEIYAYMLQHENEEIELLQESNNNVYDETYKIKL